MPSPRSNFVPFANERRAYSGSTPAARPSSYPTKCTKCEGMGREVYALAGGGRSTQTCTACEGTGQAAGVAR